MSFARALAHNPKFLILDEATSSVDTKTELMIREALDRLIEGRTAVVIAHRLSTIQHAHRILVFHKGRLREQGSHQELLALRGIYYRLYCQLQYKEQIGTRCFPSPRCGSNRDTRLYSHCPPMIDAAEPRRRRVIPISDISCRAIPFPANLPACMSAPTILISAGEASSDMYAARLATALRERTGCEDFSEWAERAVGGGGRRSLIADYHEVAVVGISRVVLA